MTDPASPTQAKRPKLDIVEPCQTSECETVIPTDTANNNKTGDGNNDKGEGLKAKISVAKETPVSCHLQETDVGITEYLSKHRGFQGIIKQRYSDFLVHEVSQNGEIIRLTNTDLPPPDDLEPSVNTGKDVSGVIAEDKIEELTQLLKSKDRNKAVLITVGDDKAQRTSIHQAVSEGFPGLDSTTITQDNQKYIQVKISSNQGNNLRRWPKGRGDYCQFVLYKENKDTMDAVSLIAKQIGLKASLFQYAGTKDRRAKTSQEVTVYRVSAEKLQNNNRRLRNIVAGNFRYVKKPLKLGQLLGNKFTIVLKAVTGTQEQVEVAVNCIREVGFINYYGMQRFGTMSIPTHHIGRAVLQGNWKEAVELILKPREGDDKEVSQARAFWWETRDSKEAVAKFPKHCFIERSVLQGLAEHGENNYLNALNKVARNTRLMYVHSYQSYIWNKVTSHRISKLGLAPVVGDLVIPKSLQSNTGDTEDGPASEENSQKPVPTCIDENNIAQYTIEDVVLPLPGYDVIYPDTVKNLYKDLMTTDNLDLESMRHKVKDYSLSGDYRHILVRPADVTCTMFSYNDASLPLALSDQDVIDKVPEPQTVTDGVHTAVRLEMTLPTSCYATMALREILKIDTSPAYQTTLNVINK